MPPCCRSVVISARSLGQFGMADGDGMFDMGGSRLGADATGQIRHAGEETLDNKNHAIRNQCATEGWNKALWKKYVEYTGTAIGTSEEVERGRRWMEKGFEERGIDVVQ